MFEMERVHKGYRWLCLLLLSFSLGFLIPAGDVLAGKAKWEVSYEKGLKAASQQNWDYAIKNLTAAYDETGPNSGLVFNIALAHASRGDVLPAAAWFRAYLIMVPDAENAPQVKNEIARLDKEVMKGAGALLRKALVRRRRCRIFRQMAHTRNLQRLKHYGISCVMHMTSI